MQGAQLQLPAPAGGGDRLQGLLDLALARQEHQHRFAAAALIEPVALQGAHHLPGQGLALPRRQVADLHRMAAPFACEQTGLGQLLLQRLQVERGRHHQQPQFGHQQRPGFPQQRQCQIGFAAPFVEFIEDHAGHALQRGIGLQLPQEQAIGEHLDAGGRRYAALQAHAIPHPLADWLPQLRRQTFGCGLRGHTPGFQHQDPAVIRPACRGEGLKQGQRHPGCFAGTWRCLQQQRGPLPEPLHQLGQQGFDRQGRG